MKRKLFGDNKNQGVSGTSLLAYGLSRRTLKADPHAVVAVHGEAKPARKVKLRKEPLPD